MAAVAQDVSESVKPRRVRGPRKSTLQALERARTAGYEAGRRDAAPPMLVTAIAWCAGVAFGVIVGAWLF